MYKVSVNESFKMLKGRHDAYYTIGGGTQRGFHGMGSPFSGI